METKLPFRVYRNNELLTIDKDKEIPIVEDILFENDYTMLIAKEKVGKSLLAMQLACSITSGEPFLDTFNVPKPQNVWYFATEGKDWDFKKRLINMSKGVKLDTSRLMGICSAGFRFNTPMGRDYVSYLITRNHDMLPKVIIIDALYMAIKGSLKDDEAVNQFNYEIRKFAEVCDAAVMIVHHSRRPVIIEGKLADMGDDDVYGSAFLKATVDHCFYMSKTGKRGEEKRFLKCSTQRSGNIAEDMELYLHEPSPLFLEIVDKHQEHKHQVETLLKAYKGVGGIGVKDLMKKSGQSRATVYRVLKLIPSVVVTKTRPALYYLNGNGEKNDKISVSSQR